MELPWEARGSIIYKKEQEESAKKSRAGKKLLKTQKMEKALLPTPECRQSQTLCAGGGNRWLSRNRAPGLLLSSHSLREVPRPDGSWLPANAFRHCSCS